MRAMSLAEISRCTRGELHALLRVIASELPRLAENSAELRAAHANLQNKSACKGRFVPMEKLDRLVTERLADRLLTPERIGRLLKEVIKRQAAKNDDHTARLSALRAKLADAENRLGRLYAAIESGVADSNDATLKDRIAAVKDERDIARVALDRAVGELTLTQK